MPTASNSQPQNTVSSNLLNHKPDLLAPAGDWDCAKAAIENGADAIYFGLERFNARMRAHNFIEAELPRIMEFLHQRGVKGYVTLNTLVFPQELTEAEQYIRSMIAAGVDAAIVQDVGICRLIRHLSPDFPIHASTQMTITSAVGVEFVRSLGCQLVVLARECSLKEITKIQQQLTDRQIDFPLEVFVHGALCVAYSGQCLTSEALGGRSANRGECAQACRMPYELMVDGEVTDLGDRRYLLSPQDLAGLSVLPEIIRSGVSCLKIEGRLKQPEYVANVTQVYRKAIDQVMQNLSSEEQSVREQSVRERSAGEQPVRERSEQSNEFGTDFGTEFGTEFGTDQERYNLEMAFSRGLYTGWFGGIDNQALVHARFGKKRGVYLGEVTQIRQDQVMLRSTVPIKAGDGVVFDQGHPDAAEEGGRIYRVERSGQTVTLTFGNRALNFRRIQVGDKVWKTSDPDLDRHLRQTFTGETPQFQRPIDLEVHGSLGHAIVVIARDEQGHIVRAESTMELVEAHTKPLTTERLQEQLGRLGNTPFYLEKLTNYITDAVMLPISELNRLRREIVTQLEMQRSRPKQWHLNPSASLSDLLSQPNVTQPDTPPNTLPDTLPDTLLDAPELIVLVRHLDQLQAALRSNINTFYCEFEDPRKYREAVQLVHQARSTAVAPEIWVAPPRITKPGENWILQQVRSSQADGYLVRNYDHLRFFADDRCIGDFSLNIANPLTAAYFQTLGLERLTASYDLNQTQLEDLLNHSHPAWFEITIHQHMPMFHMEHCVFCAFLSDGTDYTNCGRPCETHEVKLRDRVGTEHLLQADAGCRNTVFNGKAQTGAESIEALLQAGARHFRLEFVNENPEQVLQTIDRYQKLLRGEITGSQLWRELKRHSQLDSQLGVTRGTMTS